MEKFKQKMGVVSRRMQFLQNRIAKANAENSNLSYDKAEAAALDSLLRVASLYDSARNGSGHVENTLCMVRDVLGEIQTVGAVNSEETSTRVQAAWDKVNESLTLLRALHATDKDPG